uniref:TSG101 and ALIX binding domain-containing protein n=2 Tax=Monopterus albus TaxID=43700 RepID=A0A3Q3J1Y1_MONAL|nr:centrosomal protein of 55 kDa-like isoform X1 [Monopterus albus]XP_020458952.1 centrosomal protein of 55 kDa-like isoform X1 [Monopterus albus]XP_020458955.1 centrosomal protein of 55 kDa-like isoform X1 [Monopterus albus]XP_020458956.1 centrosomal protein of 55 kDa-like isoform X1 [Monopterus albus]XP_020458957.1 centrosomal protein of 55 kDa-like isoform X1 [Monopterus albus]
MASSRYKGFHRNMVKSKLAMVVSSLRKENVYLKKTLVELSRQHSEYYKLVERFLSFGSIRLESSEQLMAKHETNPLPSEELSKRDGNSVDVGDMRTMSSYAREIEEIKNMLVAVSTRCQYPQSKAARKKVKEMASSRYKGFHRNMVKSKLAMVVSSLRKENVYLKKTLVELSRQHSEYYKLVERFLSFGSIRLESSEQLMAKPETNPLPSEELSKRDGNSVDVGDMRTMSSYAREFEEIKNMLVTVSTRCQCLENKVARKKDSVSDEQASTPGVTELQNHPCDSPKALEKNKPRLEYDQQREACVRGILARMLWLEKQLNEAKQACSQQDNEDHLDEKKQMREMQVHYEGLLQNTKDTKDILKERLDLTQQNLIMIENRCKERELEVKELKQQLQIEKMNRTSAPEDHHCSEDEHQRLRAETIDLKCRLDEVKRKSANFELQANLFQKFMMNLHHEDQEKIAKLERQVKIASQDLEDERQACSYLSKQMTKVLKTQQKTTDVTAQPKRDQQDRDSYQVTHPPSQPSRIRLTSSPCSSLLNESFLECPSCQTKYPANHYRELINHLEICLE